MASTRTPIKHLVIIFQENVSFDHYFGTYPFAANSSGQRFFGDHHVRVNGLYDTPGLNGQGTLLTNNPNTDASGNQANPRRLDPANINDVLLCDQDHGYADEQKAFDGGKMDKFVTSVGTGSGTSPTGQACKATDVMNYYDGNTVTGMWNYAKNFAMSDNFFANTFGPSTPGAINLASGNTGNVGIQINGANTDGDTVPDGQGGYSLIDDAQPYYDDCSTRDAVSLKGTNIGDELNAKGLSWGFFQGGFRPTTSFAQATGGTQPTSTFIPDQFKGKFAQPPASDQGLCNAVHPVGAAIGGTGGTLAGPHELRQQGRLHPASRAVPVLRVDRQPASPAPSVAGGDRHRHADHHGRGAAVQHGQSPVRHQRFQLAAGRDQPWLPLARPSPGGQLPQGPGLPGRPCRLLRPV